MLDTPVSCFWKVFTAVSLVLKIDEVTPGISVMRTSWVPHW